MEHVGVQLVTSFCLRLITYSIDPLNLKSSAFSCCGNKYIYGWPLVKLLDLQFYVHVYIADKNNCFKSSVHL